MKVINSKAIDKAFKDKLLSEVVLETLDYSYTRQEMIENLGCANFSAAKRVSHHIRKYTVADIYRMKPHSFIRIHGIGMACLYVMMCILDSRGYSVEQW